MFFTASLCVKVEPNWRNLDFTVKSSLTIRPFSTEHFIYSSQTNVREKLSFQTLSAVSATLKTSDVSLNLRFSVGTKPSRNMLIPVTTKTKIILN